MYEAVDYKAAGPTIPLLAVSTSVKVIGLRTTSPTVTSCQMLTITAVLNLPGLQISPFFLY